MKALSERERLILHLRFVEDLTQSEIADRIGVSQMHVSRLIRRALARLRAVARERRLVGAARAARGSRSSPPRSTSCRRCPRLVAWREAVAADPPRRYRGERYWARPVPGFGDPRARLVVIGLAPAAHGGNRTGRVFTGDRSGDWLFAALHRAGFANQPTSVHRDDGLRLRGAYVTAVVKLRAAREQAHARRARQLPALPRARAAAARAGARADRARAGSPGTGRWRRCARAGPRGAAAQARRSATARRSEIGRYTLLGCFHPSQQNTFTGKLTEEMMDAVLARARALR